MARTLWEDGPVMVPVELTRLLIDERRDEQAIVLRDARGRELPIGIGIFEATIIDRMLQERRPVRPFTHDLMAAVIGGLGAKLVAVEIDRCEGPLFFAKLVLSRAGGGELRVDCRPSDGVALALRMEAAIRVEESILAGAAGGGGENP
jgi:bifunctional DNase/RNase